MHDKTLKNIDYRYEIKFIENYIETADSDSVIYNDKNSYETREEKKKMAMNNIYIRAKQMFLGILESACLSAGVSIRISVCVILIFSYCLFLSKPWWEY